MNKNYKTNKELSFVGKISILLSLFFLCLIVVIVSLDLQEEQKTTVDDFRLSGQLINMKFHIDEEVMIKFSKIKGKIIKSQICITFEQRKNKTIKTKYFIVIDNKIETYEEIDILKIGR